LKQIKPTQADLVEDPISIKSVNTDPGSQTASGASAGAGMDRKIAPQNTLGKRIGLLFIGLSVVGLLAYWLLSAPSGKALSVTTDRIAISTVKSGIFEDFIPIRGRVIPIRLNL